MTTTIPRPGATTAPTPGTRPPAVHGAAGGRPAVLMTPEEAAWIRANAWTQAMRKTHREVPTYYNTCACQSRMTHWCQLGQCDRCHRATPQRNAEAMICGRGGTDPVYFAEPYEHRTDIYATGPRFENVALVWLADRVCRWVCPHDCHDGVGQGSLFDLEGATA